MVSDNRYNWRYNWQDFQPRRRDIAAALAVMIGAALLLGLDGMGGKVVGNTPFPAADRYIQRAALPEPEDADAGPHHAPPEHSPAAYAAPED
jgi:hypothetical protein